MGLCPVSSDPGQEATLQVLPLGGSCLRSIVRETLE